MSKLFIKRWQLLLVAGVTVCTVVFANQPNMSFRQSFLKTFYPFIMWVSQLFGGKSSVITNQYFTKPNISFYSLSAVSNKGDTVFFNEFRGKKVLIVNTASNCGFTAQYKELEELHKKYGNDLIVIGFPANDFKQQEKLSDSSIAEFCNLNYGVSFTLMKKSKVIKGDGQHEVYQWLTQSQQNGWCKQQPSWNFCKYLINEQGVLTHYFREFVSPLSAEITNQLN